MRELRRVLDIIQKTTFQAWYEILEGLPDDTVSLLGYAGMTAALLAYEGFRGAIIKSINASRTRSLAWEIFSVTLALHPEMINMAYVGELVSASVSKDLSRPYDIANSRERFLIGLLGSQLSLNTQAGGEHID